jgi:hypothetical protein
LGTLDWYKKNNQNWLVVAILGTFGAGAPFVNGDDLRILSIP